MTPSWEAFASAVTDRMEAAGRGPCARRACCTKAVGLEAMQASCLDIAGWGFVASGVSADTWRSELAAWLRRGADAAKNPAPMRYAPSGPLEATLVSASVRAFWMWRQLEIERQRLLATSA